MKESDNMNIRITYLQDMIIYHWTKPMGELGWLGGGEGVGIYKQIYKIYRIL